MGRRRKTHRRVSFDFPADFPDRLELFREACGLSWRSLARLLGVSPYRIREWRRGAALGSSQLFLILLLANRLGLQETLMCAERDTPDAWTEADAEVLRRRGSGFQANAVIGRYAGNRGEGSMVTWRAHKPHTNT